MPERIVDLTTPCDQNTDGVEIHLQKELPVYLGYKCYAYDLKIKSHHGTYFETSKHVFSDGKNTDDIPLEELILPGYCGRIEHDNKCITAQDMQNVCGSFVPGSSLLIWAKPQSVRFFSRDAAEWMVEMKVSLFGSNIPGYDSGFESPTGFFIPLFKAEIPIIARLENLELLPEKGFKLIVLPLRIARICTVPCRAVCLLDKN